MTETGVHSMSASGGRAVPVRRAPLPDAATPTPNATMATAARRKPASTGFAKYLRCPGAAERIRIVTTATPAPPTRASRPRGPAVTPHLKTAVRTTRIATTGMRAPWTFASPTARARAIPSPGAAARIRTVTTPTFALETVATRCGCSASPPPSTAAAKVMRTATTKTPAPKSPAVRRIDVSRGPGPGVVPWMPTATTAILVPATAVR